MQLKIYDSMFFSFQLLAMDMYWMLSHYREISHALQIDENVKGKVVRNNRI